MGKSEPTPQRFRRKAKGQDSATVTSKPISNSVLPAPNIMDNLMCDNLLDSNVQSEQSISSPKQTTQLSQASTTVNGTCDAQGELTDSGVSGTNPALITDNVMIAADPAPLEDPDQPKDLCLSSHLPADCIGLSCSDITPLCSNQCLNLSACHVQKEDSLVLVVFITNSSDSDVQELLLQFDSEELEVNY